MGTLVFWGCQSDESCTSDFVAIQSIHSFGEVIQGEQLIHSFEIRNIGCDTGILSPPKKMDEDAVVSIEPTEVKPSESALITIAYDTTNDGYGNYMLPFAFTSDSRKTPIIPITMNYVNRPLIEITPLEIKFQDVEPHEEREETIVIDAASKYVEHLEIEYLFFPEPYVSVRKNKISNTHSEILARFHPKKAVEEIVYDYHLEDLPPKDYPYFFIEDRTISMVISYKLYDKEALEKIHRTIPVYVALPKQAYLWEWDNE